MGLPLRPLRKRSEYDESMFVRMLIKLLVIVERK